MRSILLLIPVIITLLPLSQADTLYVSSKLGGNYSGIQEAIDAAMSGDTILVDGGTYQESLNVTKKLTLIGMHRPAVHGGFEGSVIALNADGIVLEGFEVRYSDRCDKSSDPLIPGAGILVNSKDNSIIFNHVNASCCGIFICNSSNNSVHHNEVINNDKYGIYLLESDDNIIYSNQARGNKNGIYLNRSVYNEIYLNEAELNKRYGVYLQNSSYNDVHDNYVGNKNSWDGIHLRHSVENKIFKNHVIGNARSGISLNAAMKNLISANEIIENIEMGIKLEYNCSSNIISGNLVENNDYCGINLDAYCINNTIIGNTAIDNHDYGVRLWGFSDNNTIKSNTAEKCYKGGIFIEWNTKGNMIYGNNFIGLGNNLDAIDDNGTNIWDDGVVGNFYKKYVNSNCIDSDGDDICDAQYQIPGDSGAVDRYPLASPVETVTVQGATS